MKININLNSVPKTVYAEPGENVQVLLQRMGIYSVRNGDDNTGFTGNDTILYNGKIASAGLLIAAQIDKSDIKTVECLSKNNEMSQVQSALVDMGVVQSGYNAPAAALIISDLLERIPNPSKEDVKDALSGLFIRDSGYEQYFKAVEIAVNQKVDPDYKTQIAQEFRPDLRHIGKVRRKIDGKQLVMGKRSFVEDQVIQGSYVLKMMRSPHAHARIKSIDTSDAQKIPGVEFIITHLNCPDVYFTTAGQGFPEPSPHDRKMFGKKLRHFGDRVAAVVAETDEIAQLAMDHIKVEYEVLKPVFSIEEAQKQGAPIVHGGDILFLDGKPFYGEDKSCKANPDDGKVIYPFGIGADPYKNIASSVNGGIGDVSKGFEDADVIIEQEYNTSQVHCTPCENHTVFTRMEGDRLVIHASTQVPWHVRRNVANIIGISEHKVRVIKERVGGGYGSKQDILLEDVCAYATWKTGKSVFYQYSRKDEFIATSTRHPMTIKVKLGAKKDGTLTAIKMDVKANTGPYGNHCLTVPMNACSKTLPLFSCKNMKFNVTVFYSNIYPTGAYQGYGAPQGSFALQTALGELAAKLDMDHSDLLSKNSVEKGSVLEILKCLGEGTEGAVTTVSSCGLGEAMRLGKEMIAYGEKRIGKNPDIKYGKGVVLLQQGSGLPGLDQSNARVTLVSDGTLIVHTGGADLGTGLDTVCAKIAAEVLCADLDKISVISGDTDNTPFDTGAYASSGTYFSGNAAKKAAEDLKEKILVRAAAALNEKIEDLELEYPGTVKGKNKSISFYKIAHKAESGTGEGQLMGHGSYTTEDTALPYGVHFCEVAVNTRTGKVDLEKYYALMDCGTPINPELAEGQVYGGVLKSIGHTLWEEMKMDKNGVCLNPDLKNYGVPMIGDIPKEFKVKFIPTDDPFGPFGGKSISEVSTNGAACVISIAIHDAIGVWMRSWPFSPEKILKKLEKI
ncbi:MAG: molybdopterin-dependent oxidoreductase Mo/Fe-S-binding subunit [Proteobacteria bacterium]|nr:molybdopterin-dependent oxidoreductase Mo/Fe-S-binding subunit [Pseudomonadota bacterium]MBU1583394.1 molybdopterin-dependent oxidoreductase Mo/Fe-S-binding subunit [Pseudomonadota bacterium]MBU2454982.1 molybdopterin-dependent oxidoreductase Mo/Fe-S-binding subunit [Pseudomonadota bacterium]MBU2629678.1 molybdopterin-dependent oxidoreductase Mo/Fe-S-binding subunit [Pseudomonadota bacterium]